MDIHERVRAKHTQPFVLEITRLKAETLQSWVNREVVQLSEQNPGRGKSRLYSDFDVIKLAIMRRVADLRIDLSVARDLGESAIDHLISHDTIQWDLCLFLDPLTVARIIRADRLVVARAGYTRLTKYIGSVSEDLPLIDVINPSGFIGRKRLPIELSPSIIEHEQDGDEDYVQRVNQTAREHWAKRGIHSEPIIVFPIGEIVNATLLRLQDSRQTQKADSTITVGETAS